MCPGAGFHFPDPGRPALRSESCWAPPLGLAEASKLAEGKAWEGPGAGASTNCSKPQRCGERELREAKSRSGISAVHSGSVFHLCFRKGFPYFRVHTFSVNQLSQGKTPRLWERIRSPPNKLASSCFKSPQLGHSPAAAVTCCILKPPKASPWQESSDEICM